MIDVVSPPLLNVGGRQYRVQCSGAASLAYRRGDDEMDIEEGEDAAQPLQQQQRQRPRMYDGDEDDVASASEKDNEEQEDLDESQILAEPNTDGFMTTVSCDVEVFPFLIGREGRNKKQIEGDTGARLVFPSRTPGGAGSKGSGQQQQQQQKGEVTIRGPTKRAVAAARMRLELALTNALTGSRLDYTHFVCLPLANPRTSASFTAFKRAALEPNDPSTTGLDDTCFMAPAHLHLTLAMLKLYSEERRLRAKAVLAGMAEPIRKLLGKEPLKVHLAGLEYMNDDPAAMHVLYLKVSEVGGGQRLEALCDLVVSRLAAAGLLLPQDERKTKLHATVINTRYRKTPGAVAGDRSYQARKPFDGRPLLEEHSDLDLGIHTLPALHLSTRGSYGPDGFYLPLGRMALPGGGA